MKPTNHQNDEKQAPATRSNEKAKPEDASADQKKHREELLDESLEESFPASDPPSSHF